MRASWSGRIRAAAACGLLFGMAVGTDQSVAQSHLSSNLSGFERVSATVRLDHSNDESRGCDFGVASSEAEIANLFRNAGVRFLSGQDRQILRSRINENNAIVQRLLLSGRSINIENNQEFAQLRQDQLLLASTPSLIFSINIRFDAAHLQCVYAIHAFTLVASSGAGLIPRDQRSPTINAAPLSLWESRTRILIGRASAGDQIAREAIMNIASEFIRDWLSVNRR